MIGLSYAVRKRPSACWDSLYRRVGISDSTESLKSWPTDNPVVLLISLSYFGGISHPRFSNRLRNFRFVAMPGDHEAMYTNPALLAQKIVEAGRD